jgi:heme-degrading monooxygenase HmoA
VSVLMLMRAQGNGKELESFAHKNPQIVKKIAERAREHGVERHRFFSTDDELLVVDEWPSAEAFQRFFDENSADINDMMAKIGVTSQPSITFADYVGTGDDIG